MPKFVSGSSGHIYGPEHLAKNECEDELVACVREAQRQSQANDTNEQKLAPPKPSAVNKKGLREKQKSSLDVFKEELRRLNEERDEQRNKLKKAIDNSHSPASASSDKQSDKQTETNLNKQQLKSQPVPVPLKPDPRCPTSLTLQVNLNPRDKNEASFSSGSFDTGDPSTTNVYLGNLNPTVNENDICDIFGKFGPLASIKVMWPRTDEEKARNRNSGFVAYMSRVDAERAVRALTGTDIRGYDLKLGWGKAVPLPQNPVYIPPKLKKLLEPPPKSGLPFNAQLSSTDEDRKFTEPLPTSLPRETLASQDKLEDTLKAQQHAYDEFMEVFQRCTVRVVIPKDRLLLDRIHKTIEYVIREGPVFEAIIIAREKENPVYTFLYDNRSQEHVYYRWKLYSIMHGDDPYEWNTDEFRMFEGGPVWKPPPINPFADGMPLELVEESTIQIKDLLSSNNSASPAFVRPQFIEGGNTLNFNETRPKGALGPSKREAFSDLLRNLVPTRTAIGQAMMFCIMHADAAQEIIDCVYESLCLLETPLQRKIARLFLVSDILYNCSAAVPNASYFCKGFEARLVSIFEHSREYLINIEDRQKADKFKRCVLNVLGAWREWTLYEDEFIIGLSDILLGFQQTYKQGIKSSPTDQHKLCNDVKATEITNAIDENYLDGELLDETELIKCLEEKGLSLRWYKELELSEDEDGGPVVSKDQPNTTSEGSKTIDDLVPNQEEAAASTDYEGRYKQKIKFKTSKWETVDPNEVAEQVVRLSTWQEAKASSASPSENSPAESTESSSGEANKTAIVEEEAQLSPRSKKLKMHTVDSSIGPQSCSPSAADKRGWGPT